MQIALGTPVGAFFYNAYYSSTTPFGGYVSTAGTGVTFPATLDPTGATGISVSLATSHYVLVAQYAQDYDAPTAFVYANQAAALAAMNALIAADPTQYYWTAYPAPTAYFRTFSYPTRTLNSVFQVSTAQDAQVSYPVDISVTSVLLATTQGTVSLQIADDAAFTTNVKTLCSGTAAVGGVASITNVNTATLTGIVPAGKYAKITTANTAGTPSFTGRQGQEVLL